MGGRRLMSFREGDRSEYLAQYVLSRFSFVVPFPRQEDFGVADFLCVLAKEIENSVYPRNAYYVQVKSTEDNINFDRNQAKWLSHFMDLPLLLCVVNKDESRVKLFSCWHIWSGLFQIHIPEKLILILNSKLPLEAESIDRINKAITIPIGPPVINATIEEIESKPTHYHDVLTPWLEMDKLNIARRSVGRIFSSGFIQWKENEVLEPSTILRNIYSFGAEYNRVEMQLAPLLTALAHNYRHNRQKDQLNSVIQMLQHLRPYLDDHGIKFADKELLIQDED